MKKMIILVQGKDFFGKKFKGNKEYHVASKLDLNKMIIYLSKHFSVEVTSFHKVDLKKSYKEYFVIYASTEERGMFYKGYMEDILLKLAEDGAILVPDFRFFRAHGNKVFQEILRKGFSDASIKNLDSIVLGSLDELDVTEFTEYPYVVKSASGSGSSGVKLVHNSDELKKAVKNLSKVKYMDYYYTAQRDFFYSYPVWKFKIAYYKFRKRSQSMTHPEIWMHNNKVVIQNFIEGLSGDYKVLFYYGKYYVLNRLNRSKDFRASGSGKFLFPTLNNEVIRVLNYAKKVIKEIKAPMISMDIAVGKASMYLIEFQCLCFGPYTIQYAEWHFEYDTDSDIWITISGCDDIEIETARSISSFIEDNY